MKIEVDKKQGMSILKRLYCFSGRATRTEFWLTVLGLLAAGVIVGAVGGILEAIGLDFIALPIIALVVIALLVASVANVFRRVHDLGLSGFWMFYLSFLGLPCLYVAYVMDALRETTTKIWNIRAYLLTALYNAPITMGPYYAAAVRHDYG